MKKTYNIPTIQVVKITIRTTLMNNISVNTKEINRNNAGLGRQDNGWDIWGSDEDAE